jgi:hypothetical protein
MLPAEHYEVLPDPFLFGNQPDSQHFEAPRSWHSAVACSAFKVWQALLLREAPLTKEQLRRALVRRRLVIRWR